MRFRIVVSASFLVAAGVSGFAGCGIPSESTAGFTSERGGDAGTTASGGGAGSAQGGGVSGGKAGSSAGGKGGGATGKPCSNDAVCDDANSCTTDACVAGSCVNSPALPDSECDTDDDRCNGFGACVNGTCKVRPETAPKLDDGDPCTDAVCDKKTGNVTHIARVKPTDSTVCTKVTCNKTTGAIETTSTIDDDNLCTIDECDLAIGAVHTPVKVTDNKPCTKDTCFPKTGIKHDDIVGCTGCKTADDCDDGDPCTTDSCGADGACATTIVADGTKIDFDNNVCNGIDTCVGGKIIKGTPDPANPVDDKNKCTADACDPTTGVVTHTAIDASDGNQCTVDSCDPVTGAVSVPVDADDKNACTTNDRCDPAAPPPGLLSDSITGCTKCAGDGDCAGLNQTCQRFTCEGGQCKRTNLPTDAACTAQSQPCQTFGCTAGACGVVQNLTGNSCDQDASACNGTATCQNGTCTPVGPQPLNDGKGCTDGVCNDADGSVTQVTKMNCQACTSAGQCTTPPNGADLSCAPASCGTGDAGECAYTLNTSGDCGPATGDVCMKRGTCNGQSKCGAPTSVPNCCKGTADCVTADKCYAGAPVCTNNQCNFGAKKTCGTTCSADGRATITPSCNPADGGCTGTPTTNDCGNKVCSGGSCVSCSKGTWEPRCPGGYCADLVVTGTCCDKPVQTCGQGAECGGLLLGCPACGCPSGKICKANNGGNQGDPKRTCQNPLAGGARGGAFDPSCTASARRGLRKTPPTAPPAWRRHRKDPSDPPSGIEEASKRPLRPPSGIVEASKRPLRPPIRHRGGIEKTPRTPHPASGRHRKDPSDPPPESGRHRKDPSDPPRHGGWVEGAPPTPARRRVGIEATPPTARWSRSP